MSYSRIDDIVKLAALGVPEGERSEHMVCPICNGGSKHERSFIVTRYMGTLFYRCYRASCPTKGRVGGSSRGVVGDRGRPYKRSYPYTGVTTQLPIHVLEWLSDRYRIDSAAIIAEGWVWNEETQRIIQPIRNPDGAVIGHNARYWYELDTLQLEAERRKPKAITYWNDVGSPFKNAITLVRHRGAPLVLLEDMLSATRVAYWRGGNAMAGALLGTDIDTESLNRICAQCHPSRIVLTLDADATVKAIKLLNNLRGCVPCPVDLIPLSGPDIKDMTDEELTIYMGALHGTTSDKCSCQG